MIKIRRIIRERIQSVHDKPRGRILLITGARQTGKSTLARDSFPHYPVLSFDAPVERAEYARWSPSDWIARYPRAILDEAQKLPAVFDTIKACYDRNPEVRYVILGSSQILLLKRVAESLAGRVTRVELFPLVLPEWLSTKDADILPSLFTQLAASTRINELLHAFLPPGYALQPNFAAASEIWEKFLQWGGMPALSDPSWGDLDRTAWLRDYQTSYLQRDLLDLAQLDHLEPFVRAQKALALRTAQLVNFSELGRLADISPPTAKKFLRYLEISYQTVVLPAWFRNAEKRLSKQPKLHFLDPGIRRAILRKQGDVDGFEFESAVYAEMHKHLAYSDLSVDAYHLRTVDGREVDILLEREDGFIAIEIKKSHRVGSSDFRNLHNLDNILDKPVLLALVVSNDTHTRQIPSTDPYPLWNIPAPALFGHKIDPQR